MIGREGLHRLVLLDLFEQAGAERPRSYISTGNVSFTADEANVPAITSEVTEGVARVIGRNEGLYVRSISYLESLVATDPFAASPFAEPLDRTISFRLEAGPVPELPLMSRRGDAVVFAATPGELFAVSREVDGRTSGAGGMIEKHLGERVTTRGWATVLRVLAQPE